MIGGRERETIMTRRTAVDYDRESAGRKERISSVQEGLSVRLERFWGLRERSSVPEREEALTIRVKMKQMEERVRGSFLHSGRKNISPPM